MNTTTSIIGCIPLLFNISSNGIWENLNSPNEIFTYSLLPLLEIQILIIFICVLITHIFLRCIGLPLTVSYMVAGLILGPQFFDLRRRTSETLSWFPILDGIAALKGVQVCGSILYTFLMTVKINRRLAFHNGHLPIVVGILTFVVPLFGGLCFRNVYTHNIDPLYLPPVKALAERTVVIASQAGVAIPTVVYFLSELKIINSELGRFVLSASMNNELLGIIFSVFAFTAGTYKNVSPETAYRDFAAVVVFFLIVFVILRPLVEWIVERIPEDKPVSDVYVHAAIIMAFASAAYSAFFNMKYLLGPFLIALIIPEGPPLSSALEAKYDHLTMNMLLPISVAFSTMRCDVMKVIYEFDDITYNIFLMFITFVMKLVAGIVPCLYCKLPLKEALTISLLLCCKSYLDIILYESVVDDYYISRAMFTFLVGTVLLISGIFPPILACLYDPKKKYLGYKKRNILSLKPNSELGILTCVHKPENISGVISILQLLSSPEQKLPIFVTVLHLVKLVGKVIPVLISHTKKSNRLMNNSYIHTAKLAFSQLDSVTMTMFTALTHENLMDDEICKLSLDQGTSMIIVPSGRKWTVDGTFDSDDEAIRSLNMKLLQQTPCSIGILVDRGHFSRRGLKKSQIHVGVIFIGGKDDREALALVKMMKLNPRANVTVIRFISDQETESTNWEHILDHEVLKDIKDSDSTNCITYVEKTVTTGPEVATAVRILSGEYDLMVVGRDHGKATLDFSGLSEWMELPELGIIGDLLAARDLNSNVSVLVVQQQQQT